MKTSYILSISLATTAYSQLIYPELFKSIRNSHHSITPTDQIAVMANDPNMPPSEQDNPADLTSSLHSTIISDVLGKSRMINIFSGFTRDIEAIAKRLSSSSTSTTLLAPVNSAIEGLPRKPWEDANDAVVYEGEDGKDKAQENLKKFVESHVVPLSPWPEGEKVKTMAGQEIWWVKDGDKKMSHRWCRKKWHTENSRSTYPPRLLIITKFLIIKRDPDKQKSSYLSKGFLMFRIGLNV